MVRCCRQYDATEILRPGKSPVLQENGTVEVHLLRKEMPGPPKEQPAQKQKKESKKAMDWQLLDAAARGSATNTVAPRRPIAREMTDEEEFLLTARLRDFSDSDWVCPCTLQARMSSCSRKLILGFTRTFVEISRLVIGPGEAHQDGSVFREGARQSQQEADAPLPQGHIQRRGGLACDRCLLPAPESIRCFCDKLHSTHTKSVQSLNAKRSIF